MYCVLYIVYVLKKSRLLFSCQYIPPILMHRTCTLYMYIHVVQYICMYIYVSKYSMKPLYNIMHTHN